ncbi:MAG: zinc ribbon domain-containing protein [Pirellulaceae bacterium]
MPIEVLCPGCKTRFQVSEKFVGKKGPCPKCKTVITIPEKTAEVVVHAPQEFGPKNAAGVGVLKPIVRKDTKVSPLVVVGILSGIIMVLVVALLLRGLGDISPWVLGLGAFFLAPPLVLGGYTFLRDPELEPYRGVSLMVRVLICGALYAALWGAYAWLPGVTFNLERLELFHLLLIVPPLAAAGTFVALYSLDLAFTDAMIHYAFYVLVTVVLCLITGVSLLGPPPV